MLKTNSRAKERGQRRKWKKLRERIHTISDRAYLHTDQAYEHFHVPSDPFLDSPKTSGKIKTAFCREWIGATERLIERKPADIGFCKVVCDLCLPELWASQIIIFYDKAYYDSFWERNNEDQRWIRCTPSRSLLAERNIQTDLPELLIHETLRDEGELFHFDLWYYGEWPAR